jgi:tetraacyldisaccharide 4'-kinase
LANANATALDIGDEPMQFYLKFPDVAIAVGEQRILAIPQLLHDRPATQAIILDDAFQHRSIRAGLNILLTDYSNLFTRDFYLPTGDLRDLKSSYRRADILIVTKCKPDLTHTEKQELIKEINPGPHQDIFFTTLMYGDMYHITTKQVFPSDTKTEILLVTGIANPKPLKKMLEEHSNSYHMLHYSDHHIFTIDDLSEIRQKFKKIETSNKIILTTEKDAVRLVKFNNEIAELPVYVIPVRHFFLFQEGERFDNRVSDFIKNFKTTC